VANTAEEAAPREPNHIAERRMGRRKSFRRISRDRVHSKDFSGRE
jgi:hypothetical protein